MILKKQPSTLEKMAMENFSPKPRLVFRFFDLEHYNLVKSAADRAGLSLNAWIVQATLARARADLEIK